MIEKNVPPTGDTAPLLEAVRVSKSYAGVHALRDASFELRHGEVHALIGENGAGKSTLIKIMTGAVTPDSGELRVTGHVVQQNSPAVSRALGIAPIYQQPALFPHLSVAENIAIFLETGSPWRRVNWRARRERARELLARAGAAIDPERLAGELTMPEQQMVEIAKAIGSAAGILILDEPTASLNAAEVASLFAAIRALRGQGAGVLYISHRLEEIANIADRITVLRDGVTVATRENASATRGELIHLMVGRELASEFPAREATPGEVALAIRGPVNLEVRAGEIVGLAGLAGAGRTELAEAVFGLTKLDGLAIEVCGRPATIASPTDAIAQGIAYVPADRPKHGVILEMALKANVSLASLPRISPRGLLDREAERDLGNRYMGQLRIKAESVEAPASALSGGNQQKVALARWLAVNPAVLILDEPTQGVDVGSKAEIHRIMAGLAQQGMAILMISSDMPELLGMSDRVAVMHSGSIRAVLSREESTPQRILASALGTDETFPSQKSRDGRDCPRVSRAENPGRTRLSPGFPEGTSRPSRVAGVAGAGQRELAVALAIAALWILVAVRAPQFFLRQNLIDLAMANMPALILALGMTLVIVAGQIDISLGSAFAICSVTAGLFAKAGLPIAATLVATVAAGAALGALNGALVAYLRMPSIVVTLASMVALRDGLRWATQGAWVDDLPPGFQWFGLSLRSSEAITAAAAIALIAAVAWGSRNLAAGRAVYAAGSNANAARLAGVDPAAVTFAVFAILGALTGLAALLNSVRFNQIPANAGIGLELKVIAAVVVGGTAITGGRGTILGTILGTVLLGSIGPALEFLGLSAYWEQAIQGAIILITVASVAGKRSRDLRHA